MLTLLSNQGVRLSARVGQFSDDPVSTSKSAINYQMLTIFMFVSITFSRYTVLLLDWWTGAFISATV
jgi:hypothetical protein